MYSVCRNTYFTCAHSSDMLKPAPVNLHPPSTHTACSNP